MIRKRFKDIYQEGKHIAIALQISTIDSYERNFRWARTWTLWILKKHKFELGFRPWSGGWWWDNHISVSLEHKKIHISLWQLLRPGL